MRIHLRRRRTSTIGSGCGGGGERPPALSHSALSSPSCSDSNSPNPSSNTSCNSGWPLPPSPADQEHRPQTQDTFGLNSGSNSDHQHLDHHHHHQLSSKPQRQQLSSPCLSQSTRSWPALFTADMGGPAAGLVRDTDEDDNCPVCLESLALRLQGEKPHIQPVCGHKLHQACFEAVYGSVQRARLRAGSLGLCGVCRRDMKLGETDHGPGKNKFAALTGLPGGAPGGPSSLDTHKVRSISKRTLPSESTGGQATHDPADDDAPVYAGPSAFTHAHKNSADTMATTTTSHRGGHPSTSAAVSLHGYDVPQGHVLAQPKVTVRAEHSTVLRQAEKDKKSNLTCLVTVEMPTRIPNAGLSSLSPAYPHSAPASSSRSLRSSNSTAHLTTAGAQHPHHREATTTAPVSPPSDQGPGSVRGHSPAPPTSAEPMGYSYSATGSSGHQGDVGSPNGSSAFSPKDDQPDAFNTIVRDLQARMADWKGHSPDDFGRLHMFDLLHVRKDKKAREFYIYLFTEALLCVSDDGRKGLGSRMLDNISGHSHSGESRLRLKGRVYLKHMASVRDTSDYAPGSGGGAHEYSLTITMDDDSLDTFVILFPDGPQMQRWRTKIESLAQRHKSNGSIDLQRVPSGPSHPSPSNRDSAFSGETDHTHSSYATDATRSSRYTRTTVSSAPHSSKEMAPVREEAALEHMSAYAPSIYPSPSLSGAPRGAGAGAGKLPPIHLPHDFPSIDLMLVFSVPTPTSVPSSYELKLRLIRNTLDFVVSNVGPRARVSIVAFTAGDGPRGMLRKTPLLSVSKPQSMARLSAFIDALGNDSADAETAGYFDKGDEAVNVVTAVNLALDVVLQRKAKSSLTGMVLMNDSRDSTQKHQMDLVMARAEAAAISIHAIGWSRSHDPASLWLLSNYTSGTYTFVHDLYGLRDAVAGCVGGMLSVVATNFKLFLSVAERRWFRIRKVSGVSGAIVSSDGGEVDIMLGEMRLGEKREMLIEVEMGINSANPSTSSNSLRSGTNRMLQDQIGHAASTGNTATDDFLQSMGINGLSLEDDGAGSDDFYEDSYNSSLIDDVPVFEANASFRDPILGKTLSRLPRPALLLITVLPPLNEHEKPPTQLSDVNVVRRRVELLVSDMMTRCLLLMSRRNSRQAQRLMSETRRIVSTIYNNVLSQQPSTTDRALAEATLSACIQEVETLLDGIGEHRDQFETNHRNVAGQSAVSLRDQRSWTGRTPMERLFWRADHSQWMARRSAEASS